MLKLKKIIALIVTFCMISTLTPGFTQVAYSQAMPSVSFPISGEDNFDADKVFFSGDTLEFTVSGLPNDQEVEYRVEFGIETGVDTFVSIPVGTECISDVGGVSNYISATSTRGAITLSTEIADNLDNGVVAVKLHYKYGSDWDSIYENDYLILQQAPGTHPVIVGLDSTFGMLPDSPTNLIEGSPAGYWVTDSSGGATIGVNNLYDTSVVLGKVINDVDGDYSTYDDMIYGTISFVSLNFMDSDLMESLDNIFNSITMEQAGAENFTLGLDTTTASGIEYLSNMGASVSLTSPYFEGKDLTADAFTTLSVDDVMGGEVSNQSFVDATYSFDVTHFSDYEVELTYYYYSGTTSTSGVAITLLDRYLDEIDGYSTISDEEGSFEITGVPAGKYYLGFVGAVEHEYSSALTPMWDTAQDGNVSDRDITMLPFGEYTFTITDGNGDPIEGAEIVFDTYNDSNLNSYQGIDAVTGEDGTVTTSAILGGAYKIIKDGYKTVKGNVSNTNKTLMKLSYLTLTADKTTDIDFDEEVTFTATLEDSDGTGISGQSITFTGYIDGIYGTLSDTTDSDGKAYFTGSVTGEDVDYYDYEVSFSGEDNYYSATPVGAPIVVGVSETPLSITTAEELAAIGDTDASCAGNYILANDIDLTDYISANDGDWDSIDEFCGVFDGNGKTITGLSGYYPLFKDIYAPAVIKDFDIEVLPGENEDDFDDTGIFADEIGYEDEGPVTIENINISGSTYNDSNSYGTTAGFASGVYGIATISDCHVDVDIITTELDDYYSGGFMGFSGGNGSEYSDTTDILIENCNFTGSFNGGDSNTPVYSDEYAVRGGFIGDNNIGSVIENCYANIDMYLDTSGYGGESRFGGFAGRNAGSILESYATGDLKVINNDASDVEDTFVGGLVGRNVGTVENCFANMDITVEAEGGGTIGGLIGSDTRKSLINSYATGTINAVADNEDDIYIGGIIGSVMVKSSFWDDYDEANANEPSVFENLSNTYYNSDIADVGIGAIYDYNAEEYYLVYDEDGEAESKDASTMKTKSFASTLNNGQSPAKWNSIVNSNVNGGYPVPLWVSVTAPYSGSSSSSVATYTVTFNTNGGIPIDSLTGIIKNATISKPANPINRGFDFAGWFTDSNLTKEFDFSSKVTSSITLYAKWTPMVPMGGIGGSLYFTDVTATMYPWAIEAIDNLGFDGVVNGIGNNLYGPSLNIIRGDFILMSVRGFNLQSEESNNFTDVPSDSYYRDAIAVAKALDIAKGDGINFNPQGDLTRQDAMVLVHRVLEFKGMTLTSGSASDLSIFTDVSNVSDYAVNAASTLVKAGIIKGDGAYLNPRASLSRAEMAVILYRALQFE
ncbi:MAG: S-layer homology domain-containing protein [Sedimentibacter sp.]